ncbi:MAG: hypothetical protein K0S32_3628 [Bacteroidetes bacterium]|jgi:hypothetical protein|nr:hypothetical protein [Bacteroidota bacterium]
MPVTTLMKLDSGIVIFFRNFNSNYHSSFFKQTKKL